MDCPRCGLANTPAATRCDCGYDLTQPKAALRADRDALIRRSRWQMLGGIGLASAGALIIVARLTLGYLLSGGPRTMLGSGAAVVVGLVIFERARRRVQDAKIAQQEAERA